MINSAVGNAKVWHHIIVSRDEVSCIYREPTMIQRNRGKGKDGSGSACPLGWDICSRIAQLMTQSGSGRSPGTNEKCPEVGGMAPV